jgi:hypothetical protein
MEQCCGSLVVERVPGNTAISALILQRERELSLAHGQWCRILIMKQRFGPLAFEIVKGKH